MNPFTILSTEITNNWTDMSSLFNGKFQTVELIIIPLAITIILSSFIGIERQNIGKAAGLSSHMLVAVASCAIAIMQLLMFRTSGVDQTDPNGQQRVIAQVITGVGFLGAGVIIKNKMTIKGLTTAATIWAVSMIGIIVGSGYTVLGVVLGLFIVLFLYGRDFFRGVNPFKPIDGQKFRKQDDERHNIYDTLLGKDIPSLEETPEEKEDDDE